MLRKIASHRFNLVDVFGASAIGVVLYEGNLPLFFVANLATAVASVAYERFVINGN